MYARESSDVEDVARHAFVFTHNTFLHIIFYREKNLSHVIKIVLLHQRENHIHKSTNMRRGRDLQKKSFFFEREKRNGKKE